MHPISSVNVLFVSRQRITGRTNGSSVYLLDIANAVKNMGHTPHLLQPSPSLMGRWPVMRLHKDMRVFETHKIRGVFKRGNWVITKQPHVLFSAARGLLSRLANKLQIHHPWLEDRPYPYAIAEKWTAEDRSFLKKHSQHTADIIIADYAFQAEAISHFHGAPSAIVMHDLFHSRQPQDGESDSVAQIDQCTETELLSKADAVIAIQSAEADFIRQHLPKTQVLLTPIAIKAVTQSAPGSANTLLFVGSNTAPNVAGLRWFFTNVWPQLQSSDPSILLDVVGSVASAFHGKTPHGVCFHGVVDNLDNFYQRAGIIISPLPFGSGLKIKLVEAMAHGKAIVATSITLQGIEQICQNVVWKADTADEFLSAITALISNTTKREELAQRALETAEKHFSPEACHADLTRWISAQVSRFSNSMSHGPNALSSSPL